MGWWESNVAANQMLYYFCFLFNNNTPPSWMALATLFLLFSSYLLLLGFGFFSILYTSLLLILSTTVVILYSTVSKHKAVYVDNLVPEEKDLISFEDQESSSDQKENYAAPTLLQKHGSTEEKEGQEVHKPDLLSSESECQDQYQLWTSDESEVGWSFQYDVDDNSDGSISDEESLIEIALPSGHQQTIIREFLAEFNEEENLIEIDISMGSIKYSRFEIKA
ncbi:PREDICTED: uncharacterized protein LOC109359963 isoform X2 [Lupinus angustifolius]|uniref:uncharacterized protein LOC109359963 isoform X2 n=1 Tax=Lupinus angustifolius TaxID=3871 RepID=UPI00092F2576|nr:PREDICTED: uncharacterized protein LOC109359963 isoform X2 [Lupinus angustifolius]